MSNSNCCFLTCIQVSQEADNGGLVFPSLKISHSLLDDWCLLINMNKSCSRMVVQYIYTSLWLFGGLAFKLCLFDSFNKVTLGFTFIYLLFIKIKFLTFFSFMKCLLGSWHIFLLVFFFFFFKIFLLEFNCFTITLVSAVQWSEPAVCLYTCIPPSWTSLLPTPSQPSPSSQSAELSSPCCTTASH